MPADVGEMTIMQGVQGGGRTTVHLWHLCFRDWWNPQQLLPFWLRLNKSKGYYSFLQGWRGMQRFSESLASWKLCSTLRSLLFTICLLISPHATHLQAPCQTALWAWQALFLQVHAYPAYRFSQALTASIKPPLEINYKPNTNHHNNLLEHCFDLFSPTKSILFYSISRSVRRDYITN